jgi:hypothetical protein
VRKLSRLLQSFLVGLAASFSGNSPRPVEPAPIQREAEDLEQSLGDCAVRTRGSVRYTYAGPMISLSAGGVLERTAKWKTVLDRDFRNRCVEGTGFDEFVQARTRDI